MTPGRFSRPIDLENRFRFLSPNPNRRLAQDNPHRTARDLEAMPFPIDGLATGFEDMLKEEKNSAS